jgi:hypothetical protein
LALRELDAQNLADSAPRRRRATFTTSSGTPTARAGSSLLDLELQGSDGHAGALRLILHSATAVFRAGYRRCSTALRPARASADDVSATRSMRGAVRRRLEMV